MEPGPTNPVTSSDMARNMGPLYGLQGGAPCAPGGGYGPAMMQSGYGPGMMGTVRGYGPMMNGSGSGWGVQSLSEIQRERVGELQQEEQTEN